MTLAGVVCLLLVHVVFSDAIFLVLCRILRGVDGPSTLRIFALTRGLGPAAVSVSGYALLIFLPGRSPSFYVGAIVLVLLLPGLLALHELPALVSSYRRVFALAGGALRRPSGLVSVVAVMVLLASLLAVVYPLVEHDALSAAMETRIAVRDGSLANFMAVRVPDPETGYYMENFRTPFLQMLNAFYAWALGRADWDWPARWTSSLFYLHGLLLLATLLRRGYPSRVVSWGTFLLAATPIYFYMGYNNGIDTARIYLLLVALAWIVELVESGSKRVALAAGIASGFALFSHLLGAPSLAWGGLVHLMKTRSTMRQRLASSSVLLAAALVAGAQYHYLMAPGLVAQIDRSFGTARFAEMLSPPQARDSIAKRAARTGEAGSPSQEIPKKHGADELESRPEAQSAIEKASSASGEPEETRGLEVSPTAKTIVEENAPARAPIRAGPTPEASAAHPVEAKGGLLAARGHGATFVDQLLFGRLQIFTGVEYFGFLFWIAAVALVVRISRRHETSTLGLLMSGAVVLTALVVLSGVRRLSWSNPRYIATLIPMAAYLTAPLLASLESRLGRRHLGTIAMVMLLSFPVLLVTSIRGAKVEITNPGTFYSDFRSMRWLGAFFTDPGNSLERLKNDYLGIRKSLTYLLADRDIQLRNAHDYFAATLWIRDSLPADARILVFRDARFFYYGGHKAIVWYSPEMDQKQYQYYITRPEEMHAFLLDLGLTHILVDDYSTRQPGYFDTAVEEMMPNESLVRKIFEFKTARVYELLPTEATLRD